MKENANEILVIDDTKYITSLSPKYKKRKPYKPDDPKMLTAFIPGTIPEIMVKPGDKVNIGDTLLLLEAMKMNNNIKSPVDGVVKKLHIEVGQRVAKHDLLLEFE